MKILELAGSGTVGTDEMGPVSTDVCELSNQFAALGHRVTLVDARSETPRSRLASGIEVVEVDASPRALRIRPDDGRFRTFWNTWVKEFAFVRSAISAVRIANFDVIHTHEVIPTLFLQKFYGVKCAYTAHTYNWCIERLQGPLHAPCRSTSIGKRLAALIETAAVRGSRVTIALGPDLARCVPSTRVCTIPNGLDFESWKPVDQAFARRTLGIDANDFLLLFIGRVIPVKGVDILLDAVASLAGRFRDLRVVIMGSLGGSFNVRDAVTPYAHMLMDKAKDLPVRFVGFINRLTDEFRYHVSAADVVVLPSRSEPQGMVVLEALAMGKPVIASNTGGIPAMIHDDTGLLFTPGDSTALAARIRELYDNRERLERMKRASRAHVQDNYSWSTIATRYLNVFGDM
jgi:glycosyltransferase involved in cell wall biosynthesis